MRALVIGSVASFKECWTFRKNLAAKVGCSVRTVQRALTQAREEGLIGMARAQKTEIPPGWEHGPIPCGWSHRWVIGWGQAAQKVADAVHAAKARWLIKVAMAPSPLPRSRPSEAPALNRPNATARPEYQRRTWTASELDAELERLATEKPPPT